MAQETNPCIPVLPEAATIRHIRGEGLVMMRALARGNMVEADWQRFLGQLEPEHRALLESPIDPETWVPLDSLHSLVEDFRASRMAAVGDLQATLAVEHFHAGQPCPYPDGAAFLRALPGVFARKVEGGLLQVFEEAAGIWRVDIWALPPLEYFFGTFLRVWIQSGLRLAGQPATVTYEPPPTPERYVHTYRISWA